MKLNLATECLGDHQTCFPECGNDIRITSDAEFAMSATTFPSWVIRQFSRYRKSSEAYARAQFDAPRIAGDKRRRHGPRVPNLGVAPRCEWVTKIFRSVSEIDQKDWDAIVEPGNLLKTHAYLRAVEESGIDHVRYYFPTIMDRTGLLIAHACVYVIDTDLSQLLPQRLHQLTKLIRKVWKRFLVFKVTDCAIPLSTGNAISTHKRFDKSELVTHIAAAVETISKREGCLLVVIRDFLEHELADFDGLRTMGYKQVSNMPVARIHVRWKTYNEYLSSMRARYRTDVKRRLRRAGSAGQTVRKLEQFAGSSDLWAAQALTVQERTKGFRRELLTPRYYESMDKILGDKSMLVIAERGGRAVAHGMLLQDKLTTTATFFGRNPGPAHHEWFHLVNEVIRLAIENKSTHINLGLGSYDAKINVGAEIERLFVYSKSSIGVINWLMGRIPQTMNRVHPVQKQIFHENPAERC